MPHDDTTRIDDTTRMAGTSCDETQRLGDDPTQIIIPTDDDTNVIAEKPAAAPAVSDAEASERPVKPKKSNDLAIWIICIAGACGLCATAWYLFADKPSHDNTSRFIHDNFESQEESMESAYQTPSPEVPDVPDVPELELALEAAMPEDNILEEQAEPDRSSSRTTDYGAGSDNISRAEVVAEIVKTKPQESVAQPDKEDQVFAAVEQAPQFPGGEAAMFRWLAEHINYPPQAAEEDVQGKVTVKFVVEKDGSISNVTVARGKHPALDAEAVRVVKRMPKWIPGRMNGEAVRVTYIVPITFRLQ